MALIIFVDQQQYVAEASELEASAPLHHIMSDIMIYLDNPLILLLIVDLRDLMTNSPNTNTDSVFFFCSSSTE